MNRKMWSRIALVLALATLVVAGGVLAAPSPEAALARAARNERVVSHEVSLEEQLAAQEMVTEEVIASAKPLPMPALQEGVLQEEDFIVGPTGPFGAVPGGLPEGYEAEALLADLAEPVDVGAPASLDAYSYPPPYTRYTVNQYTYMWKYFPWMTMGKLLFKKPGDASWYYCTASVMYGRALWTAGHCVYTKGKGWHTNMTFAPAYRNGTAPYGTWTVYQMATLTGWQSGNYAYDIGAAAVSDQGGKKISQVTGYLGAMWNVSATQHFHSFGLPSNILTGKYLIACAASTNRQDPQSGPDPIGIGCDMLHGSSGGPRLVTYAPYASGANNYVNGVNSYCYTNKPKQVYAAYFGNGAKNLYNWGKTK